MELTAHHLDWGHRAGLLVEMTFKQVLQLGGVERGSSVGKTTTDSTGEWGFKFRDPYSLSPTLGHFWVVKENY